MKCAFPVVVAAASLVGGCQSDSKQVEAGESAPASNAVTYAQLLPVLAKCVTCHGEADLKEGLDVRTYASLMKGSKHGPVVVPGDPENSTIVHALRGTNGKKLMPQMIGPLPEEEIALVEQWIRDGAKE